MSDNSWIERHRPDSWGDIQGNTKALKQIKKWAENWSLGDEPQLLVGDPGTGKTTTAYVASDEMGYPLNEINASEARKTEDLKRIVGSIKTSPADAEHQLVLLDEIDNMHHSVDKSELYDALRSPRNPIILTANDEYDIPDPIKRASNKHEFKLGKRSRKAKIKEIAQKEGVDLSESELKRLVERPDLRSAINDLQRAAGSDKPIGKDNRTWSEGEFPAIEALLSGDESTWRKAVGFEDETFDRIDSAILWADENLSEEFRGLEVGVAYSFLSTADYWAGKAWEDDDSQSFRFQKYAWSTLSFLPETRLSEPYDGWIDVNFPEWFRASEDKHDGSTGEAKLYQALKGDDRGFDMAGPYLEFKQSLLPLLRDLDREDKMELILNNGLDEDAIEALGVDPDEYEEWRDVEAPEEGEGWSPDTVSASETSW